MDCRWCGGSSEELGKTVMASGKEHLWYRCPDCGQNSRGMAIYIGKKKIKEAGIVIDTLPIFLDYRGANPPCVIRGCDNQDTELHHFGPRALFPETFESWPTGYLCHKHHREWADKIDTPLRVLRMREAKANE